MRTLTNTIHSKRKQTRTFITLVAMSILSLSSAQAEIYKQKQPDGSIIFTDQPQSNEPREKVKLQPTAIIPSIKTSTLQKTPAHTKQKAEHTVTIHSPSAGQTYRGAEADAIQLKIQVAPPLGSYYTLQVTVDGQAIDANATSLPTLYRGEHTVTATLTNKAGKTITSTSSTFFVHRFTGVR